MKLLTKFLAITLLLPAMALAERAQQVDFLLSGFRDAAGANLAGGLVYTYEPNTTTPRTCWSDRAKASALSNPIVLDGYGKKQAFCDGAYDFVVKDSGGSLLYTFEDLQYGISDSTLQYGGTSTGGANTYAVSVSPALTEYTAGMFVEFLTHQANTSTTPTLAVNGLAAKTIINFDGAALHANDIQASQWVRFVYDGTNFRFAPQNPVAASWTPTFTGFSANPTNVITRYVKVNRGVWISVAMTAGTSNATGFTMTAPFAASNVGAGGRWSNRIATATDNGTAGLDQAYAEMVSGSDVITLRVSPASPNWTNANGKGADFTLYYEVD